MKARVFTLRLKGRRVKDGLGEGIVGDLRLHSMVVGTEVHRIAQLCGRTPRGSREDLLLDPIFEPELVAVGAEALLIRGFESAGGAGYVQEWHCVIALPDTGTL